MELVLMKFERGLCSISLGVSLQGMFLRRNKKDPRKNKTVYFHGTDLPALVQAIGDAAVKPSTSVSHRVPRAVVPTRYGRIYIGDEPYWYGRDTVMMLRQNEGVAVEHEYVKDFHLWLLGFLESLERFCEEFGQSGA